MPTLSISLRSSLDTAAFRSAFSAGSSRGESNFLSSVAGVGGVRLDFPGVNFRERAGGLARHPFDNSAASSAPSRAAFPSGVRAVAPHPIHRLPLAQHLRRHVGPRRMSRGGRLMAVVAAHRRVVSRLLVQHGNLRVERRGRVILVVGLVPVRQS